MAIRSNFRRQWSVETAVRRRITPRVSAEVRWHYQERTQVHAPPVSPPRFEGVDRVLQVEAMAQVASILMLRKPENQGKIGYFMSANEVKFRKPVVPGDTLFIEAEILKVKRSIGVARARCVVNGEVVSEAELMFSLMDR